MLTHDYSRAHLCFVHSRSHTNIHTHTLYRLEEKRHVSGIRTMKLGHGKRNDL